MADQVKNILIGLFVLAACSVVIFMLLFLHPTVGDERRVLRVRFANIDKVSIGTRVTFAGRPVGEVVSIHEVPQAVNERIDFNGYVYVYELRLRVDSSVNVFKSDELSLKTSGLLGEKSVAITPFAPKKGEPLVLVNDDVIYAYEGGTVDEAVRDFQLLSNKFQTVLDNINETFVEIRTQKIVANLGQTLHNVNDIISALDQPKMLMEIIDNAHTITQNAVTLTQNAVKDWAKVEHTLDSLSQASDKFLAIADHTQQGGGTVGGLLMKDDVYLQTSAIISKANTLFNDVNHYGLLFHLDKGWQRLRARRMNLLYKLSTPQEFRNFFNDEVDQVSTSLARVEMLLDETTTSPCCLEMRDSPGYAKVFRDLMERVSTLEDNLKFYNQQFIDETHPDYDRCYYQGN